MTLLTTLLGLGVAQATGDTLLSGLVVNGAGFLEFAATSTLVGEFRTPDPISTRHRGSIGTLAKRELFVSWHVLAYQIPPFSTDRSTLQLAQHPGRDRMTSEGFAWLTEADRPACSVLLELRVNGNGLDDGWGSWRKYRGGVVKAVAVQFRVKFFRPDTSWQISVEKANTRVRPRSPSMNDLTPEQFTARAGIHERRRRIF